MEIIETIKEKLLRYPHIRFEEHSNSITIFPISNDGFELALYVGDMDLHEPFQVCFNGWHEDFSDNSEALERFAFGLSEECRLKEFSRGGQAYKWTVEFRRDGSWQEDSTTSLLLAPFWRAREMVVLQNHLIPISED